MNVRAYGVGCLALLTAGLFHCSTDDSSGPGGASGGTGGSSSGAGGSSGNAGAAATGGAAGSNGTGTGTGGANGTAGSAGTGGAAGSGGAAGTAGGTGGAGAGGAAGSATTGDAGFPLDAAGGAAGALADSGAASNDGAAGPSDASTDRAATRDAPVAAQEGGASPLMNMFVTSANATTGNLGGLAGADQRCQQLAAAVGHGDKTWRAYLSAETPVTHARDRIAEGPYYNARGVVVAATKDALHAAAGDAALFLTEQGNRINGQWTGSPTPNQHDILTGSTRTGMLLANSTCASWTATTGVSGVGHSDGLGQNMMTADNRDSWNGAHTGQCSNTSPGGGAGKTYCFVGN